MPPIRLRDLGRRTRNVKKQTNFRIMEQRETRSLRLISGIVMRG